MNPDILLHLAAIVTPILIAAFGFIFGALWGHHAAIEKRVTQENCLHNRENCYCFQELRELKEELREEDNF